MEVIIVVCDQYLKRTTKVYFYSDLLLGDYTTTCLDIKKGKRKMSKCDPI